MDERRLEQVLGEYRGLDDREPAVDLTAQAGAGEGVAGEDRAHGTAEFFEGLVGGCLGPLRVKRRSTCSAYRGRFMS